MRVGTIKRPTKEKNEKDVISNYFTTRRLRKRVCSPVFPSKALKTSSLSSDDVNYSSQNIGLRYMFENPDLKIIEGITSSEESSSSSGTNTPNVGRSNGIDTPNIGSSSDTDTPNIAGDNVVRTVGDDFVRAVVADVIRTIGEKALSNSHVPISYLIDRKDQSASLETSHIPFANIDESIENRIGFPISSESSFPSVASAVRKLSDLSLSDNPSPSFLEEPKRQAILSPTVAQKQLVSPFKEFPVMLPKRTLSNRQLSSTSTFKPHTRSLISTSYSNDVNDHEMNSIDAYDSPLSSPSSVSTEASDISFMRVTSFSAFSSALSCDAGSAERKIGKLRKERRLEVIKTEEFARLRFDFSKNSLTALVSKLIKKK
jgi:hypothetical protein